MTVLTYEVSAAILASPYARAAACESRLRTSRGCRGDKDGTRIITSNQTMRDGETKGVGSKSPESDSGSRWSAAGLRL